MTHTLLRGQVLALLSFAAACAVPTGPSFPTAREWKGAPTTAAPHPAAEAPIAVASPKIADGIGTSYTIAKLGTFMPSGDLESLDDGLSGELIFGRQLMSILALEGSVGYLQADGGTGGFELWAVPVFVNLRLSVPILFFEPYGGIGVGGMYADYQSAGLGSSDDFVLAGSAFVGIEFGLGRLAVGAEYKYLQTEDTSDDFAIEGGTASLFVSLPF